MREERVRDQDRVGILSVERLWQDSDFVALMCIRKWVCRGVDGVLGRQEHGSTTSVRVQSNPIGSAHPVENMTVG